MTKGVSILAIGSSSYSGWAVNFAVSLKYHSPDVAIQFICDKNNMIESSRYHHLFSQITLMDEADYTNENGNLFPAKAKTLLYKYFAFDLTAYFDVDAVIIKDISPLFELTGDLYTDVQAIHTIDKGNHFEQLKWAKPEVIWSHFGLNESHQLPAINSSFFLVRKTDKNKQLYEEAHKLLIENKLPREKYWHNWGKGKGHDADELYFNVACAKMNYIPEHLCAVYFRTILEAGMAVPLENIQNSCYAIGLFGDVRSLHISVKEYYNRLMFNYWRALIGTPFYNKAEVLLKGKIVNVRTL